jgi:hypothetical protein
LTGQFYNDANSRNSIRAKPAKDARGGTGKAEAEVKAQALLNLDLEVNLSLACLAFLERDIF